MSTDAYDGPAGVVFTREELGAICDWAMAAEGPVAAEIARRTAAFLMSEWQRRADARAAAIERGGGPDEPA